MDTFEDFEKYADYEERYALDGRQPRHAKLQRPQRAGKPAAVRAELTDLKDDIADFTPSYAAALDPLHYERQWLIDSVAPFYRDNIITDVIRRVKSGKEANVYCCVAHPASGVDLIAAKLYRPRMLRTLKNDADYKSGRQLRDEQGKQLKGRREKLALKQKTRFGRHLDMVWWIGNEYMVQRRLFEAGADVPRPIGHAGNVILMDYVGDESQPAPLLSDVSPSPGEAQQLLRRVLDNITLMLDLHHVHGDLSAFNILYWDGAIRIIDFPQVVDARSNPLAYEFLKRDVQRVCAYFARYGAKENAAGFSSALWRAYMGIA